MDLLIEHSGISIDILLMVMLSATMLVAFRLERALGVLRRDRSLLEKLVQGFNDSTVQAEAGIARLQTAVSSAGRDIARHIEQARRLESDLQFLIARGEKVAGRVECGLTQGGTISRTEPGVSIEMLAPKPSLSLTSKVTSANETETRPRSQAERDLMLALRAVR